MISKEEILKALIFELLDVSVINGFVGLENSIPVIIAIDVIELCHTELNELGYHADSLKMEDIWPFVEEWQAIKKNELSDSSINLKDRKENEFHNYSLYWAETEDHHEDWFIIALNETHAAQLHEEYEGYSEGKASATKVMNLPVGIRCAPGWPDIDSDFFTKIGAEIRKDGPYTVIALNGKEYKEGLLSPL